MMVVVVVVIIIIIIIIIINLCFLLAVEMPVDGNIMKRNRTGAKAQEIMHSVTTNVEHEMYEYTDPNGATGLVTKGSKKSLEAKPRKYSTDALQKTATLGPLHIIWKVMQSETGA
jgi:uncharacterized protein YxeA